MLLSDILKTQSLYIRNPSSLCKLKEYGQLAIVDINDYSQHCISFHCFTLKTSSQLLPGMLLCISLVGRISSSSDSISLRGHNRQPAHCHHHIHYQSSNPSPYPSITIISITKTTIISKASADTLSHQNANFNIHYIIPVIFFIVPIGKFVPGPCATSKVLVYIFVTNASGAIWWPNLHPILKWDIVWLNLRLMR